MKTPASQQPSHEDPRTRQAFAQALETLNRLGEERAKARAVESDEVVELTRALEAPFLKQIDENPEAAQALQELRHRVLETAPFMPDLPVRDGRSGGPLLDLHLQEHLSVIGAPYDFEWQRGHARNFRHNRLTGEIAVGGESGGFINWNGDRVDAAAGIGIAITTDRPAFVSVRPFINYRWQSLVAAYGAWSSGNTRGGIDAAAFLDGAIIDGVRRSQLFDSRSSFGQDRNSDDGVVWVPDVTLGFHMQPRQVVVVNFGAWVECDHSNGIGIAGGEGVAQGIVSWVVVERFLGP